MLSSQGPGKAASVEASQLVFLQHVWPSTVHDVKKQKSGNTTLILLSSMLLMFGPIPDQISLVDCVCAKTRKKCEVSSIKNRESFCPFQAPLAQSVAELARRHGKHCTEKQLPEIHCAAIPRIAHKEERASTSEHVPDTLNVGLVLVALQVASVVALTLLEPGADPLML